MSNPKNAPFETFFQVWKSAFCKVLTQLGASCVSIVDTDPAGHDFGEPKQGSGVAMRFTGSDCLKGCLQWSAGNAVVVECAQLLMSEPLNGSAECTAMHVDGFQELVRQLAGEVALNWKQLQNSPATLLEQPKSDEVFPAAATVAILVDTDKCKGLALCLELDTEMLAAVSSGAQLEVPRQGEMSSRTSVDADPPHNLDLILDVQLEATIRFGQREMLLREVFGLMPGAVVELNQSVNEPAELLVGGRLVATGEVVVVDGNFGLRVKEVVSPAQRLMAVSGQ